VFPLWPPPTRQLLNEVALELQEHLGYLTLFWSEKALPPNIIRAISARLAEIAMLMPRVGTARAAEQVSADALDATSAPALTQPGNRLGELESMVATAYEGALDAFHQADVLRDTAEGIYLSLALAKRLRRDAGSPSLGVDDRTEFALTIARRRIACNSRFALGVPATATDVGFGQRRLARRHWASFRRGPSQRNGVPLIDH
jgi:hypothetical protein